VPCLTPVLFLAVLATALFAFGGFAGQAAGPARVLFCVAAGLLASPWSAAGGKHVAADRTAVNGRAARDTSDENSPRDRPRAAWSCRGGRPRPEAGVLVPGAVAAPAAGAAARARRDSENLRNLGCFAGR
jgi:hypothetical protein